MKHQRFLRSAAALSLGGLISKAIGVFYRVPLAGLLGGYGMGLYHMAYPLFCVLLSFSSAGIPSALSRLVARETARGGDGILTMKTALRLFAALGLAGASLMCLVAPAMSRIQGDVSLISCYYLLAPSVLLVSVIAVLRGYFQGKSRMLPTAVSEVLEEAVKCCFGLFFALRYRDDPARAVACCLLSVTVSEAFALVYLAARAHFEPKKRTLPFRRATGSEVLLSALPVMASAGLLPLSRTADSVLLPRLLGRTREAVSLYGLFAGSALSLVGLPATVCYGIAAASVPAVSRAFARGEEEEGRRRALYALLLTLALSLPCAVGLFLFAGPAVSLLYPALSAAEKETLVSLLKLMSVSSATLAGVDTLAACLTGMGRAKSAAISMLAAVLVKTALQALLVGRLSIGGAAIASNACYLVAFFLDLFYTVKKKRGKTHDYDHRVGSLQGQPDRVRAECAEKSGQSGRPQRVSRLGGTD